MASSKKQNPGADQEVEATAPGAVGGNTESNNEPSGESGAADSENTDQGTESADKSNVSEEKSQESEPEKNDLKKYGLNSKDDLKPEVDVRNGKVVLTSDAIPDGSLLTVRINGQTTDLEFTGGMGIYAKGGSFFNYPAIEID